MSELIGSAARVLSALGIVAEANAALGVKDLADALQLPMSTSHRLLDLLVEAGYVQKDPLRRRYSVGMEFFRIASLVAHNTSLPTLAQPLLDRITRETGETTLLGIYLPSQLQMTYAAKCDSPDPLRYKIDLYKPLPLEWGATGLAILAFLPEAVQEQVFARARPAPASAQTIDRARYFARIAAVQRDGYAQTENEKLPDSIAIGAPLATAPGNVVASIAVTIPKIRFDPRMTTAYSSTLAAAAAEFCAQGASSTAHSN